MAAYFWKPWSKICLAINYVILKGHLHTSCAFAFNKICIDGGYFLVNLLQNFWNTIYCSSYWRIIYVVQQTDVCLIHCGLSIFGKWSIFCISNGLRGFVSSINALRVDTVIFSYLNTLTIYLRNKSKLFGGSHLEGHLVYATLKPNTLAILISMLKVISHYVGYFEYQPVILAHILHLPWPLPVWKKSVLWELICIPLFH